MWFAVLLCACLGFVEINAQSGRSCRTPNGEVARCTSIYSCQPLLQILRDKGRTADQLKFLKDSQCGYETDPLVCCGSEIKRRGSEGDDLPVDQNFTPNSLIPDRSTCGFQLSERIFNGEATALDEFPWMALLIYGNRRATCGGSLISSKYVLTAAHCVTGSLVQKAGNLISVRLGEWDTNSPGRDCISQRGFTQCNEPQLDIDVDSYVFHPTYNPNELNRYYDIALVRMKQSVRFTDYIRAICLPFPNENSGVGTKLIVAGWGRTEKGRNSNLKLKVEIPVADASQCTSLFRSAGVTVRNSQICAGGEPGKDSCTGDSGGPLMSTTSNDTSQWYIEGLVSFGGECGKPGWPAVYTKITTFLSWIHNNVKP